MFSKDTPNKCQKAWGKTALIVLSLVSCGTLIAPAFLNDASARLNFPVLQPAPRVRDSQTITPVTEKISSLGRLEPRGEIASIRPPASMRDERIGKVLVKAGDKVRAGQVLVLMDSYPRLVAALSEAECRVATCQAQLDKVMAGPKVGELQAQKSVIARSKAELLGRTQEIDKAIERLRADQLLAKTELDRHLILHEQGAISSSQLDAKKNALETTTARLQEAQAEKTKWQQTATNQIEEAQANLSRIAEVRSVDVNLAKAELKTAHATAQRIKVDMELSKIRAPHNGEILKVYAHDGEGVSEKGLLEIGQTNQMIAVAEVFESDIEPIRKGQNATVTGPAFAGSLMGKVIEIAPRVTKQNVLPNDPGANFDNRVVEVKILLTPESSRKVSALSNLQVVVEINV